ARAQSPVDFDQSVFPGVDLVHKQGVSESGADVRALQVQQFDFIDSTFSEIIEHLLVYRIVALGDDLARGVVDYVLGQNLSDKLRALYRKSADSDFLKPSKGLLAQFSVFSDQNFACFRVHDIL